MSTLQTKRPDERGNAPQAMSSETLAKGKPMNSAIHNTPSPERQQRDQALASAMSGLEGEIHDLYVMSHILGDLLDDNLVEYRGGDKRSVPQPGQPLQVILSATQMNMLCFAWNDVIDRAQKLQKHYLAAFEGASS